MMREPKVVEGTLKTHFDKVDYESKAILLWNQRYSATERVYAINKTVGRKLQFSEDGANYVLSLLELINELRYCKHH